MTAVCEVRFWPIADISVPAVAWSHCLKRRCTMPACSNGPRWSPAFKIDEVREAANDDWIDDVSIRITDMLVDFGYVPEHERQN